MEEPMTMRHSAIAIHELYTNLRQAGFNRREALSLVSCMMLNVPLDPNG